MLELLSEGKMKTCEFNIGNKVCGKPATHGVTIGRCEFVCWDHCESMYDLGREPYRLQLDGETLGRLLEQEMAKMPAKTGDTVTDGLAAGEMLNRVAKRWNEGDL